MPPPGPDSPADDVPSADPPSPRHADQAPPSDAEADEFNEFPGLFEGDADGASANDPADTSAGAAPPVKPARGEMGFLDHLEEFRVTILKSLAALIAGMALVGVCFPWFFNILLYPLHRAVSLTGLDPKSADLLYVTTPMGAFTVLFEVTIFGGIGLALPFIGYFVITFVAPGLTEREKGLLRPALISALLLFTAGALFSFFFLAPASLAVSLKLNSALGLNQLWSAADYYELVTWLTLGTGLVFEFPLILVILQVLGVVSTDQLRHYRRHAIVVILVIAGLIAPPEVVAMTLMAVPMYLLFEASLVVGERIRRRHLAAKAVEEAQEFQE